MSKDFELMRDTLEGLHEYITRVVEGITEISSNIQGGREDKAINMCIDLIDGLKWITYAIALTNPIQQLHESIIETDSLQDLFLQIVEAFENSDYVMLSDLLEYELASTLQDIQNKIGEILLKAGDVDE